MLRRVLLGMVLVMAMGCGPVKDGQIVAAVVTAELAQRLDAAPGDIEVEQVRFQDRRHAEVEAVRKMPGGRFSQREEYRCKLAWTEGRWHVASTERREL